MDRMRKKSVTNSVITIIIVYVIYTLYPMFALLFIHLFAFVMPTVGSFRVARARHRLLLSCSAIPIFCHLILFLIILLCVLLGTGY